MAAVEFSKHALEQMALRSISVEIAQSIINNPQQTITQEGKRIYQSIINFEDGDYLIKLFINIEKQPNLVITIYKTSKIEKYYEG